MTPATRRIPARIAVLAVLALLVAAACSNGGGGAAFAARVNESEISDAEVRDAAALYSFLSGLNDAPCGGEPEEGEAAEAPCNRFALTILIQQQLVDGYAMEHDLSVTDQRVEQAMGQVAGVAGGEDELRRRLEADGLTVPALRELARKLLLFDEVQQELARTELSDAELRDRYAENEAQYTQLHTEHILVETEEEARDIAGRATEANFQRLARQLSTDPSAADNGGDLGSLPAGRLDPGYVAGALALQPGEISGPVQSQFGWHVIRLVEKQVTPFEQVREDLQRELSADTFQEWIRTSWTDGDIEVNPRYGRFDTESGRVVSVSSNATGSPEPQEADGPTTP